MSEASLLEARRMRLRGIIRVASEVLAPYWPMRSFVHHNPLHGLEGLPFDEAVRLGERLYGGPGYLPAAAYRAYLHSGRIRQSHLDEALQAVALEDAVVVGDRRVTHHEVLNAWMVHGIGEAACVPETSRHSTAVAAELTQRLAGFFAAVAPEDRHAQRIEAHRSALGRTATLAQWCDQVLGTDIVKRINDELVKWCEAFLDEGHATWPMPGREQGFYLAWRTLAAREWRPCGIAGSGKSIKALPDSPEDAIHESLTRLGVPDDLDQDYLALEVVAQPGWAGFIKWRSEQRDQPWQKAYPASLVKYLAIRLWYERELVEEACQRHLGISGSLSSVLAYMREHPRDIALKEEQATGRASLWGSTGSLTPDGAVERLFMLASALELAPEALLKAEPGALFTLVRWTEKFAPADRNLVWQRAFEAGYHESLLTLLERPATASAQAPAPTEPAIRPQTQSVYCLDVRTEPFRRHLESMGDHETYAFAGFFGAAIRFRQWGRDGHVDQVPAVMQPRNEVREVPRTSHAHLVAKHRTRAHWRHAGHMILRDLKENIVTPYIMVETIGWFYGLPLVAKTLLPGVFRRVYAWIEGGLLPAIPTSLTVDKLPPADVEQMVASEQRDALWKALRARFGERGVALEPRFIEAIRLHALGNELTPGQELSQAAEALGLAPLEIEDLVQTLRRDGEIEARSASRRKERLTRTGITLDEQVVTVETVLRTLGLTANFARLVLVCGHGSTSENNPYESALDCGACGGNAGSPNARAVATMANNPKLRERLALSGISIPPDAHFLAGQLDTTTHAVRLYDLEDVPPSHRKDVERLQEDLAQAGRKTREQQLARLPDVKNPRKAPGLWSDRSADWSQVRPEWGLSGNAALIVGPRSLTKGLDLGGRVFLNSYDPDQDPTGRLLEVILTSAQMVAQWICMEHYFSTTAGEVYGSGSKVYHNVTGRVGVMSGPSSDLRLGLSRQTVMSGETPFHEPLRLLTVVAARRATLEAIIARHLLLQNYYRNEWVHLVAWDPDESRLYRYHPTGGWSQIALNSPASNLAAVESGKEPIA